MRVDDRVIGLVLVALGAAIFSEARTFPLMAGLPYGPGFFPSIAAVGLMVCGVVVAATGLVGARSERSLPPEAADGRAHAPHTEPSAGRSPPRAPVGGGGVLPRDIARPAALVGIVVAFGLALQPLGFHATATLAVGAAALVFGARPIVAVPLALLAAFGTHVVFYSFLRVPLPWGLLEPVAW